MTDDTNNMKPQETPAETEVDAGPKTPENQTSEAAQTETPQTEAPQTEAPHNPYAAKASSVYQQNVNNQANQAAATPENPAEQAAATMAEEQDVWDTLDGDILEPEAGASSADVAALEAQVAELKDQLARAVAEQENVRKRLTKQADDAAKFAASKFAGDMLSVADNLRRALESVAEDAKELEAVKNIVEGVELTERDLLAAFERHKLVQLNPTNEKFDPNLHEAMFEIPTNDVAPGTVMQVVQPGYTIADRLLRPARVGVSKAV